MQMFTKRFSDLLISFCLKVINKIIVIADVLQKI